MSVFEFDINHPSEVKPVVLIIAANDSSGLAGITSDIKTQAAFSVHSSVVVTANTAQNNCEVLSINPVDISVLKSQLDAVVELEIRIVKVGLIANIEQAKLIAEFVQEKRLPMVLDPVLGSTSQFEFFDFNVIPTYLEILLPLCLLITPNRNEAAILSQLPVGSSEEVKRAANKLLTMGAQNILIKGGREGLSSEDNKFCDDFFLSKQQQFWLTSKTIETPNSRGTGCALASAISAALALGYCMNDSVVIGKMAINQGLRNSYSISNQKGPVAIQEFPRTQVDLPTLRFTNTISTIKYQFPECYRPQSRQSSKLGLYPIVDRAKWVERLAAVGVTTIQLRVKDLYDKDLEQEVVRAIEIARQYRCRLFINDYWQLAIKHQAYGVHLGQEDLDTAGIELIQRAGLRLGISTHCHYEVARAHYYRPSYIACGPVYHTDSKQMPWIPQGLKGLNYWLDVLDYPVVAIGGINQQRFNDLSETKVNGIAMITAISLASNPELVVENFIREFESRHPKRLN